MMPGIIALNGNAGRAVIARPALPLSACRYLGRVSVRVLYPWLPG